VACGEDRCAAEAGHGDRQHQSVRHGLRQALDAGAKVATHPCRAEIPTATVGAAPSGDGTAGSVVVVVVGGTVVVVVVGGTVVVVVVVGGTVVVVVLVGEPDGSVEVVVVVEVVAGGADTVVVVVSTGTVVEVVVVVDESADPPPDVAGGVMVTFTQAPACSSVARSVVS
jgi:hypothetical protein